MHSFLGCSIGVEGEVIMGWANEDGNVGTLSNEENKPAWNR